MSHHDQDNTEDDATSVTEPSGRPSDAGKAYDPEMTDEDEANVPPDSDADVAGGRPDQGGATG